MPDRSKDCHSAIIKALACNWKPLQVQSFENHLFQKDGQILKLYRWELYSLLSRKTEFERRKDEQTRLAIYAPLLNSKVVCLKENGVIEQVEDSKNASCFGILLRQSEPLIGQRVESDSQKIGGDIALKIGSALEQYHRSAPKMNLSPDEFKRLTHALFCSATAALRNAANQQQAQYLIPSFTDAILDRLSETALSHEFVVTHGDFNISNTVIFQNKFQFIDPGYALLFGAGIASKLPLYLSIGWDLATFCHSLEFHSESGNIAPFLEGYIRTSSHPRDRILRQMKSYEILLRLLIATVSLKFSSAYQDPNHFFAQYLAARRLRLKDYISAQLEPIEQLLGAVSTQ